MVAAPDRGEMEGDKTLPDDSKKSLPVSAGFISLFWSEYMLGWALLRTLLSPGFLSSG